jgi:hypothetical protein
MAGANGPVVRLGRFIGRYLIAAVMIPVGVALGLGGLIQFALRRRSREGAPPPTAG